MSETEKKSVSKIWYLLPIFMGIIGGVIMFVTLRKEDMEEAKTGLVLGIIVTGFSALIGYMLIYVSMLRMLH